MPIEAFFKMKMYREKGLLVYHVYRWLQNPGLTGTVLDASGTPPWVPYPNSNDATGGQMVELRRPSG
jgi:hypothetical protein